MTIPLIQYFVHDATINDSRIGGSQSLTISKNMEPSDVAVWGNPSQTRSKFYKKPTVNFSLEKILTDDYGPTFGSFNLAELITKRPVDKYDLGAKIYGGGSIKLVDSVLTGISYSFRNQGWFIENLSFQGVVSEAATAGTSGTGLTREETGIPYQRQHYLGGTLPSDIVGKTLLGIEINISISYAEISSFGSFPLYENKFVQLPVDISVTYETLDRGYSQSRFDYFSNEFNDEIEYDSISIVTVPVSINLGTKNVLTSVERSGATAGDSDYSIVKYVYRNVGNYFKITFGSSNSIDGNLFEIGDPNIDGNILSEFTFIDGNL